MEGDCSDPDYRLVTGSQFATGSSASPAAPHNFFPPPRPSFSDPVAQAPQAAMAALDLNSRAPPTDFPHLQLYQHYLGSEGGSFPPVPGPGGRGGGVGARLPR